MTYSSQIFPSLLHDLYKVEAYPKEMIKGLLYMHPNSAIVIYSPLVFNWKSAHIYITNFSATVLWKYDRLSELYNNLAGETPPLSSIINHLENNVQIFDVKGAQDELACARTSRILTVVEAAVLENFIGHHDYKHTYNIQKLG